MARKWIWMLALAGLLLNACGAQDVRQPTQQKQMEDAGVADPVNAPVFASSLVGGALLDESGKLGTVEQVLFNSSTGTARWLVVKVEEKTVLLPWGAFRVVMSPAEQPELGLSVFVEDGRSLLVFAPAVSPADLQENLSTVEENNVVAYWSERMPDVVPVTGGEEDAVRVLAPGADGAWFEVLNDADETVGAVQDIVFRPEGTALFYVMEPHASLQIDGGLLAIASTQMQWVDAEGAFVLIAGSDRVAGAPRVDPQHMPDTTLAGWENDWLAYWSAMPEAEITTDSTGQVEHMGIRANGMQDYPLLSLDHEKIGKLVDWTLNADGSEVFGIIALDNMYIPLPWHMLRVVPGESMLEAQTALNVIIAAPSFTTLEAMDSGPSWYEEVLAYWANYNALEATPNAAGTEMTIQTLRASQVFDKPVVDATTESLGTVADFIFGPSGEVIYLVLDSGTQFRPVPWSNFTYQPENHSILYVDDALRFADAPGFSSLDLIEMEIPNWDAEIRKYWGME